MTDQVNTEIKIESQRVKLVECNSKEIKDVPGFVYYRCTEDGDIISSARVNEIVLKPKEDKDGYLEVTLYRDKSPNFFKVHQVVAITWHGDKRSDGYCVNHKNGNRKDNHKNNLEWLTPADNERHARRVLGKRCIGEKASRSKLKSYQIPMIKDMVSGGLCHRIVAKQFDISQSQISRICRGVNWAM